MSGNPAPVQSDTIRVLFAEVEAEVARNKRLAKHIELTRERAAVQAVHSRIINTATHEHRAAREATVAEEWER